MQRQREHVSSSQHPVILADLQARQIRMESIPHKKHQADKGTQNQRMSDTPQAKKACAHLWQAFDLLVFLVGSASFELATPAV
jgi:hypothetical protein